MPEPTETQGMRRNEGGKEIFKQRGKERNREKQKERENIDG